MCQAALPNEISVESVVATTVVAVIVVARRMEKPRRIVPGSARETMSVVKIAAVRKMVI